VQETAPVFEKNPAAQGVGAVILVAPHEWPAVQIVQVAIFVPLANVLWSHAIGAVEFAGQ
jgi:hypothetical protein